MQGAPEMGAPVLHAIATSLDGITYEEKGVLVTV